MSSGMDSHHTSDGHEVLLPGKLGGIFCRWADVTISMMRMPFIHPHFIVSPPPLTCFPLFCGTIPATDGRSFFFLWSFFFFFFFFRAEPLAYGGPQARGLIGAAAAHLHHSHSNTRSEPCVRPTSQLTATPDP